MKVPFLSPKEWILPLLAAIALNATTVGALVGGSLMGHWFVQRAGKLLIIRESLTGI